VWRRSQHQPPPSGSFVGSVPRCDHATMHQTQLGCMELVVCSSRVSLWFGSRWLAHPLLERLSFILVGRSMRWGTCRSETQSVVECSKPAVL
jgi:hypothetical protein